MKILKNALINSLLAFGYIALIATIIRNGEKIFDQMNSVLAPTAFLLTFVISAAMMGILIFGRPVLWYLENKKQEAVKLALYTVGFLLVILIAIFGILIIYR